MAKIATIPSHLEASLGWRNSAAPATLPARIEAVDEALGGWPRGRISEIAGEACSGRTTLLHRLLAEAAARGEICAVVDAMDAFDPVTAELHGAVLARLVWVRCGGNLEYALHAADLLLHAGGLGVVAIDLCDADPRHLGRIPPSYWFRFRRAVEASQTICLVLADRPVTKSCSSLLMATERRQATFTPRLFRELTCRVVVRKPYPPRQTDLHAQAR